MNKLTKRELKEIRKVERQAEEFEEQQAHKRKQYAIWGTFATLIILSFGLIFYFVTQSMKPQPPISKDVTAGLPPVTAQDNVTGPNSARVTLIEYGDFQCPACGHYFPMVTQLKNDYKDTLRVVYRNFPLTTVHDHAMAAAQAAYAASKQGKFWEMHDLLYENQTKWAENNEAEKLFGQYATELKLDIPQFNQDMNSEDGKSFIMAQEDAGAKAGVQATPTFFVNGKVITNPATYDEFKKLIDEELN